MHDLRDGQSVAFGRVRLIEQAGEEAQPYRPRRCRHPLNLVLCWRQSNIPRAGMAMGRRFFSFAERPPSYGSQPANRSADGAEAAGACKPDEERTECSAIL